MAGERRCFMMEGLEWRTGVLQSSICPGRLISRCLMLIIVYISYLTNIDFEENVLLITSDYIQEVFEAVCEVLKEDFQDIIIYYFANHETEYE